MYKDSKYSHTHTQLIQDRCALSSVVVAIVVVVFVMLCCYFQIKVSARCPVDLVKDMNTISKKLFPDIQVRYHHIHLHMWVLLPIYDS